MAKSLKSKTSISEYKMLKEYLFLCVPVLMGNLLILHRFIALSLSEYNDANITGSCQSLIRSCNRNSTGLHHIDLSVLDISVVVEIKINSGGLGE